jgi:hypothetical protein
VDDGNSGYQKKEQRDHDQNGVVEILANADQNGREC